MEKEVEVPDLLYCLDVWTYQDFELAFPVHCPRSPLTNRALDECYAVQNVRWKGVVRCVCSCVMIRPC